MKSHEAIDPVVRWFHWINFLCLLGLIAVGVVLLFDDSLALGSDAKVKLKTVHVIIGYVFGVNLLMRLWWGFVGRRPARWRAILPVGRRYRAELRRFLSNRRNGRWQPYLGYDPLGRIAIMVMFALLFGQALTGLALAGTDLFLPPFGRWIAGALAAPGIDPATLAPYAPSTYDPQAFAALRAWRSPIAKAHEFGFYALLAFASLHIAAVIVVELRTRAALVSSMFSGRKFLESPPPANGAAESRTAVSTDRS